MSVVVLRILRQAACATSRLMDGWVSVNQDTGALSYWRFYSWIAVNCGFVAWLIYTRGELNNMVLSLLLCSVHLWIMIVAQFAFFDQNQVMEGTLQSSERFFPPIVAVRKISMISVSAFFFLAFAAAALNASEHNVKHAIFKSIPSLGFDYVNSFSLVASQTPMSMVVRKVTGIPLDNLHDPIGMVVGYAIWCITSYLLISTILAVFFQWLTVQQLLGVLHETPEHAADDLATRNFISYAIFRLQRAPTYAKQIVLRKLADRPELDAYATRLVRVLNYFPTLHIGASALHLVSDRKPETVRAALLDVARRSAGDAPIHESPNTAELLRNRACELLKAASGTERRILLEIAEDVVVRFNNFAETTNLKRRLAECECDDAEPATSDSTTIARPGGVPANLLPHLPAQIETTISTETSAAGTIIINVDDVIRGFNTTQKFNPRLDRPPRRQEVTLESAPAPLEGFRIWAQTGTNFDFHVMLRARSGETVPKGKYSFKYHFEL